MKIEAMPVKVNITKENKSNEKKSDEFSKVLSKEVKKEDKEVNRAKENSDSESELDLDLDKKNKKSNDNILDDLLGMLNMNFVGNKESKISPEIVQVTSQESLNLEEINPNIIDFDNFTLKDISLNADEAVYFNVEDLINETTQDIKNSMIDKEVNPLSSENDNLIEIPEDSIFTVDKSIDKAIENIETNNKEIMNEGLLSKFNSTEQKMELDFAKDTIEEVETPIKIETKEKSSLEDSSEVNLMDNSSIKNFDKINADIKPEVTKPVLSDDNLQRVNDAIIEQIDKTTNEGTSVLKVKLYPEDLGTVDVTVTMEEGKLVAKILVDNEHVKGLFAGKLSELNESLIKQNIQVEKINIDLNLNANSENNQGFDLNQHQSFNHNRNFNNKNQIKVFNSKIENIVSSNSSTNSNGAISILA